MGKLIITDETPVILATIPAQAASGSPRIQDRTTIRVGTHMEAQRRQLRTPSYRVARETFTRLTCDS